ncbi:phage portal protein [Novosphingobium humi]|uniref:Phage portal protein n=1 Tax=Novosphingobium humi TaxID=2282397 RepID=A0ABY7U034_9SPHN|nr:phage portal protein [Novosphingobium humi]WCT78887.1 phage portal protein [Novosphingobium humi]
MMSPDDYKRARGGGKAEVRAGNPFEGSTITSAASAEEFLAFFGMLEGRGQLPPVSIEAALEVPAVFGAVAFLSRTLATLPLHAFRTTDKSGDKLDGDLAMLLNEAPNPEWSSFAWRQYTWQQVFTGGRGMSWIERKGITPVAIWPMDPAFTTVQRISGRKTYRFEGREYPATDVIDVPFMLKTNQIEAYGPIWKGRKAIALAIAMGDYAGGFFAGGGVPPMSLEGPLPQGPDAFKRAMADIKRAVDMAKQAGQPFFGMPPGHSLKPIGIDPAKGQMTEARLFQIQEIARIYGLPPVFLQDLSKGTFANTEQQDLQLVKHLIGQWCKAFEDELNLKLFGQRRRARRVAHNLDGLQRGDFRSRIEGFARAIQTAQMTPNEVREIEDRPPLDDGDRLYIQGATVPLGTVSTQIGHNGGPSINDNEEGQTDAVTTTD